MHWYSMSMCPVTPSLLCQMFALLPPLSFKHFLKHLPHLWPHSVAGGPGSCERPEVPACGDWAFPGHGPVPTRQVPVEFWCSLSPGFDLLTAIPLQKCPLIVLAYEGERRIKRVLIFFFCPWGVCREESVRHNWAFLFYHSDQESHNSIVHFQVFINKMLVSISWMTDNGLVLGILNWTR